MSTGWSPFLSSSLSDAEENDYYLTRELEMLERAVQDKGELRRRELGQLVGCKYWGPGRRPGAPRRCQAGTPAPPAARLLRARALTGIPFALSTASFSSLTVWPRRSSWATMELVPRSTMPPLNMLIAVAAVVAEQRCRRYHRVPGPTANRLEYNSMPVSSAS